MEELQSMNELQITAEKTWMIISTCIVIVLGIIAIAVVVWWVVENIKDMRRQQNIQMNFDKKNLEHQRDVNAAAADAGWSQYIDMKDKCNSIKDEYIDYKSKVEQWDKKRSERIRQLEKQLRDNGITPIPWDLGGIA
jgi:flagellar basal body-associated protein FliL